jgi:hypothetical protein
MTAADFREPLLVVLGHLTGCKAGQVVGMSSVLTALYAEMGLSESQLDSSGRPIARVLAQQAFNKRLRKEGLARSSSRGRWTLTEKGAELAESLSQQPKVEADPKTSMRGIPWSIGEVKNTYTDDPDVLQLAIEQTECIGEYSDRSKVCETCGLVRACKIEQGRKFEEIAAELEAEGKEARRLRENAIEALNRASTSNEDDAQGDGSDSDPFLPPEDLNNVVGNAFVEILPGVELTDKDTDDLGLKPISDANNLGSEGQACLMTMVAATVCSLCSGKIEEDEEGVWQSGRGAFHKHCYRQAQKQKEETT